MAASCTPPTRALAGNPGMCPDWELNWQPFGSQAGAQTTESHQPGVESLFFRCTTEIFNENNTLSRIIEEQAGRRMPGDTDKMRLAVN